MADLIDRQAAIDAILAQSTHDSVRELFEYTVAHPTAKWDEGIMDAIDAVIAMSEQPETTKRVDETVQNVSDGDLISRKAAIEAVRSYYDEFDHDPKSVEERIEELPSAQSERKKGKWEYNSFADMWRCDHCYKSNYIKADFCPYCGADMRGEQND